MSIRKLLIILALVLSILALLAATGLVSVAHLAWALPLAVVALAVALLVP